MQRTVDVIRGGLFTDTVANPAAQTNWIWTAPAQYGYELQFVHFLFTTDANAANRNVFLEIRNPAGLALWRAPHSFVHTASLALDYYASQASPSGHIVSGNALIYVLPHRNLLAPGWTLRSAVVAFQAGDQFSNIYVSGIREAMPIA